VFVLCLFDVVCFCFCFLILMRMIINTTLTTRSTVDTIDKLIVASNKIKFNPTTNKQNKFKWENNQLKKQLCFFKFKCWVDSSHNTT
jgi:hypothetical protein